MTQKGSHCLLIFAAAIYVFEGVFDTKARYGRNEIRLNWKEEEG